MTTMIAGALAALLSHAGGDPASTLALASALEGPSAEDVQGAEALTGRVFDLRGLALAGPMQEFADRRSTLLPLLSGMRDRYRSIGSLHAEVDNFESPPAQAIVEAFMAAFIDGENSELDTIEVLEGGLVYLVGPAKMLDQFDDFAARMGARLTSHPTLEILQFRVDSEAALSLPAGVHLGGQVERGQLESWLSNGVTFTERRIDLSESGIQIISELESHTITANVSAQIAQGSGIFEPETFEAAVGSELTLSGYRSGEGVELQYMAKTTERQNAETPRSHQLDSRHYPVQGRPQFDRSEAWSEDFGMVGGHSVGSATVNSTHYLLLSIGTSMGHVRCVAISVDPASIGQPAPSRIDAPTGMAVVTVPGTLLQPNDLELRWSGSNVDGTLEFNPEEALDGDVGLFRANMGPQDSSLFRHLMDGVDIQEEHRLPGTSLLVVSDEDANRMEQWAKLTAAADTYHVSVKTHDALGRDHHRGSVSIRSGTAGALVSGYEQLLAKSVVVEVAQRFATREVMTTTHFEGLALGIELGTAPDGSLLYGLRGQMATDLEITEGSANDSANAGLLAVSAAHLVIRETGKATPADAPGTWTIVVGDETRKGVYVELTITTQQ